MGTIKHLAEIAALVIFQEWSAAPRRRRIISDLIFSFFCTCAELAVVSRQKDIENNVCFLSDSNAFLSSKK